MSFLLQASTKRVYCIYKQWRKKALFLVLAARSTYLWISPKYDWQKQAEYFKFFNRVKDPVKFFQGRIHVP